MTDGLSQLGAAVRTTRVALGLTIDSAAESAPMSAVTWGRVERGLPVRGLTYASIERVLGWRPGTAAAIMRGEVSEDAAVQSAQASTEGRAPGVARIDDDARRQELARDDALIESIWASDLPDDDKLDLVRIVLEERADADRRARERFVERLRWRRGRAS